MKKILTATLALAVLFGLTACEYPESAEERTMRLSIECIQAGGQPKAVGEPGTWNDAEYYCSKGVE